ncbi:uncharacterized protein LOC144445447 [Glandiceps talaboti]
MHTFMKYFQNTRNSLVYHHYCGKCLLYLGIDSSAKTCPNSCCGNDLTKRAAKHFFIEISIEEQIRNLFQKDGFCDNIKHRFHREKEDPANLEDIYDGELYRNLVEDGILAVSENISLMWNTDGVPVFKSSSFSLWPLYFVVNELPFHERIKKENLIFGGLWFGPLKPEMLTFLKPFYKTLSKLEHEGIDVQTNTGETLRSKVILICGTCDLPARSMMCNSVQFNGFYGCLKCMQPGQTVKTKKGGHVHTFPFIKEDPMGPARTHANLCADARKASETGVLVNGIKGPCWLGGLSYYDLARGTGIDYMHCVLQGVMKTLFSLWFGTQHSGEHFCISNKVHLVDKHLAEIQPPYEISRCPRSFEKHQKYWKASEVRSFLLYYGLPVLLNILPDVYYQHFALLSEAIFILLQESIPVNQLEKAANLLEHFCLTFASLYGDRFMTHNVHSLLHLVEDVKLLGPLWTHSCFHFEDTNGFLMKLIHGTQNVQSQIVTAVALTQKLPSMFDCLLGDSKAMAFYNKLTKPGRASMVQLENNVFSVGTSQKYSLDHLELTAVLKVLPHILPNESVKKFSRVKIGITTYHSISYLRAYRRNSYTIIYKCNGRFQYGLVKFFFQFTPDCLCDNTIACNCVVHNMAMVKKLDTQNDVVLVKDDITNACAFHLSVVNHDVNVLECIYVHSIVAKCVFMQFSDSGNQSFVGHFPNLKERD